MGKKVRGLALKLYLMVGLPAVLVGILVMINGINMLNSNLTQITQVRLSDVCRSLQESFDSMYAGEWAYDEASDSFTKGDRDVYGLNDMLDDIYRENNVNITIFYGETRRMTNLKNTDGSRYGSTIHEAVECIYPGNQYPGCTIDRGAFIL